MKMLKGTITAAIIGMFATSLTSCESVYYTPYKFDQLRAADYILPQDVRKVLITTTSNIEIADSSFTSSDEKYLNERFSSAYNIPAAICSVLSTQLNNSQYLSTSIIKTEYKSIAPIEAKAEEICKENDAQAIIVVDDSYYSSYYEIDNRTATDVTLVTTLSNRLTFITSDGTSHRFETQRDTLRWVAEDARLYPMSELMKRVSEFFPSYKELYYSIAEQAAKHISIQLTPSWEQRHRSIFCTSSNRMISAATCVEQGEWDKARDLWAEAISKGSILEKACSTANIGLYYEREDNVIESAMWFSKALDIIEANTSNEKIQDLKPRVDMLFKRSIDRQHEKEILDRQMGE